MLIIKPRNTCLLTTHTKIDKSFSKKPATGGRPLRDKRHKAKNEPKWIFCV